MPEPYSLIGRAWLPVALEMGQRVFVRPCDITSKIDGHAIIRIASGRPDCDISLTELLIGLLVVALPVDGARDWHKHYAHPPTEDALQAAFAPFEEAFVLDGAGPRFFQDFDELDGEANGIEALFIDAPGGNAIKENADHFVKRGRTAVLSRAGAAIALSTLQTSAPAGGAGHRTSLRGGGPLTTLVFPGTVDHSEPNLWQRLWANVPNVDDDQESPVEDMKRIFPWLVKTRVSDKTGRPTTPTDVNPLQAFFGMPRRIRLNFEENTQKLPCDLLGIVDDTIVTGYITRPWGTNYAAWSRGHHLSPYYLPKKTEVEYLPLHLKSSRVGYRQWLGMVVETQDGLRVPAKCLNEFAHRVDQFEGDEQKIIKNTRLLVAGYAMDNMKPLDFSEALLPLILTGNADFDAAVKNLAAAWINAANTVASQIVSAVKRALYGDSAKADRDSTPLEAVTARFWADTENDFYEYLRVAADKIMVLEGDPDDLLGPLRAEEGAHWLGVLRNHAFQIFDDTVPIDDADAARITDIIEARKMLGLMVFGHGKGGAELFQILSQAPVEKKQKAPADKGKQPPVGKSKKGKGA